MMKDINKDAYANDTNQMNDINLDNRDMEIQFEPDTADAKGSESGNKPGPKMGGMIEQKDDMQTIDKNEIVDIKDAKGGSNILGDKKQ